jgi:YbbR domain-containing protein
MRPNVKDNLGSLLLAFTLALTVWVAATNENDPAIERTLEQLIPIEYIGLPDGLLIVSQPPQFGEITLRTTRSIWDVLTPQDIRLIADLSEITTGTYRVTIQKIVDHKPVQVTALDPEQITITIESSARKEFPIQVISDGTPALGRQAGDPEVEPTHATVVGPQSAIEQVTALRATINVTDREVSFDQLVDVVAMDVDGKTIDGVDVLPDKVQVTVDIELQENYLLISVIPNIVGQDELEEAGYRITEVTVTPRLVTIYTSDPQAFAELQGFVRTVQLSLVGKDATFERQLTLDLPPGFSATGDPTVTVRVSIEPRMNSITVERDVEFQNLGIDLTATASPEIVSLILTGPAATLDALQPEDIIVVIDLLDLVEGTYLLTSEVINLPPDVMTSAPIPATIQVTILAAPVITPTPTP